MKEVGHVICMESAKTRDVKRRDFYHSINKLSGNVTAAVTCFGSTNFHPLSFGIAAWFKHFF